VLPIAKNEKFGTFSFCGQHSGKLSDLPLGAAYSVRELRTTVWSDNHEANFGSSLRGFAAVHSSGLGPVQNRIASQHKVRFLEADAMAKRLPGGRQHRKRGSAEIDVGIVSGPGARGTLLMMQNLVQQEIAGLRMSTSPVDGFTVLRTFS